MKIPKTFTSEQEERRAATRLHMLKKTFADSPCIVFPNSIEYYCSLCHKDGKRCVNGVSIVKRHLKSDKHIAAVANRN